MARDVARSRGDSSPNVVHVGAAGSGHCFKLLSNRLGAGPRLLAFEAARVAASNVERPDLAPRPLPLPSELGDADPRGTRPRTE